MRGKQQSILWTAIVLGAVAALTVTGPAAEAGELATMNAFGGGVSWTAHAGYDGMALSVAGGGVTFQRQFAAGEVPSFQLIDAEGNALPDGTYNWELVATPRARATAGGRYASGRGPGDAAAASQARRPARQMQSGVFTVVNGLVVNPDLEEPVRRRAAKGAAESAGGKR